MVRLISEETLRRLLLLSTERKLAFLALLYERMIPELRSFCVTEGRDYSAFQRFHEQLWCHLTCHKSPVPWLELRNGMLNATPDSEDFGTPVASSALSAALVAIATADFANDYQDTHVLAAIGYTLDALDASAVGELDALIVNRTVDRYVNSHLLLERERHRQEDDIAFLTAIANVPWPVSAVAMLLDRAKTQGALLGNR